MTFQRDGSVKIVCPMRCAEETRLNKEQTVGHLATPYTIKSMLDTLQEDTEEERKTSTTTKSVCRIAESCMKDSTVFCCGVVMCGGCHKQDLLNTTTTNNNNSMHQKQSLTFTTRENKLFVLCPKHASGCTHICTADDEFLCTYCLHRNMKHINHSKNTIETEARLLREVAAAELSRSQLISDTLRGTAQSVAEAKKSLLDVLRRRKKECMSKFKALLDTEITRLTKDFDIVADKQNCMDHHVGEGEKYLENLTKKLDVEIVLMKREVLDTISKQASLVPLQSINVSLTEGSLEDGKPLGDLSICTHKAKYDKSFFTCDWVETPSEELGESSFSPTKDLSDLLESVEISPDILESQSPAAREAVLETTSISANPTDMYKEVDGVCCGATNPSTNTNQVIDASGNCSNDFPKFTDSQEQEVSVKTCLAGNGDFSLPPSQSADEHKLQGNKCFQQKRYADAVECYSKAINCCPEGEMSKLAVYYQNRAAAHEKLMKWKSVIKDCSSAIKLDRKYYKAVMRRSRAYENLGEKRKSLEDSFYFCEAQRADGTFSQADNSEVLRRQKCIMASLAEDEAKKHMHARELVLQRHQMQEYFRMFNYDVFTIPTTSHKKDSNYCEIMDCMKKAMYTKVLVLCEKEIKTRGKHRDRAKLLRGSIRQWKGIPESRKDFDEILRLTGKETELTETDLVGHTKRLAELMKLAPDRLIFIDAVMKIVLDEHKHGNSILALTYLGSLKHLDPANATIDFQSGRIMLNVDGKREEAMKFFQSASTLDPSFLAPRQCLLPDPSQSNEKEAFDFVQEFPHAEEAWAHYALCLAAHGRNKEALISIERAIDLKPSDPNNFLVKADILQQNCNDVDEAQKTLLNMTKTFNKSFLPYYELGQLELFRTNFDLAVEFLEKALQRLPDPKADIEEICKYLELAKLTGKYTKGLLPNN